VSNLDSQNVASNVAVAPARSYFFSTQSAELAPIALFVYNRPEHLRRTVESLRANKIAQRSDLFVFADGAKNESVASAVGAVRKFIRTIEGFKSVTLTERDRNFGLAASVITGVTQLVEQFGRVIAVEDDLLTAPDFLNFMNCALERYRDEGRMFSVSGFNFAVNTPGDYPYDVFCSCRCSSWGWGTWKDRWEKTDWSVSDFGEFRSDKVQQRSFNRGGEDLSRMLALQMAGKIDSWAIRWAYAHFTHNAAALLPVVSRVYNIGLDGSGVHCRRALYRQHALPPEGDTNYRFLDSVIPQFCFSREIRRRHHRSLARKLARYLFDRMGLS
jgi:glycosyltransferase involved in cell wall biosynthesis